VDLDVVGNGVAVEVGVFTEVPMTGRKCSVLVTVVVLIGRGELFTP